MTRYLLDTNTISDATKPSPSASLVNRMERQHSENLFMASLTLGEIRRGILEKPMGRKRRELETWFSGPEGPAAFFGRRVLSFDDRAAIIWARLMAEGTTIGRPSSGIDMIIAAIAETNGCVIVTDNERHFVGLTVLNPLRS